MQASPRAKVERARPLLGTFVSIRIEGLPEAAANRAIEVGFAEVARIHGLMSFHEAGSDVSRLNREAATRALWVDPATFEVLSRSLEMSAASGGAFDISIGAKLVEWGYLPPPSSSSDLVPDHTANWRDIELTQSNHVRFRRPLWIDLGGIAKGYAVDRALECMALPADVQCCVNAGGDLRLAGPRAERVLLRGTGSDGANIPMIEIENGSLASSSGRENLRRAGGRNVGPHVDAPGLRPVGTKSFATVAAESCATADALTKVVLARGTRAAALLRRFGAIAYLHTPRSGWRSIGTAA